MDKEVLSLWYLNNYGDDERELLSLTGENTFNNFKVKVKVYNEKAEYQHYLNLCNFKKAVLYGSMGSGKTFVLKSIYKNILCRSLKYCIYVDLKEYSGEDIFTLVKEKIKYKGISIEKIEDMINKDELCFLFDNYNILNSDHKKKINKEIFNNENLRNLRYIITSTERISTLGFSEVYYVDSLSTKRAYKKILRSYESSHDEYVKVKKYIEKYKLQCFLYKPINLTYLITCAEYEGNLSFIYDLKNEHDLFKKYVDILLEDKGIAKISSYISYYMTRKSIVRINEQNLRTLTAEAIRDSFVLEDVDEIISVIKDTILINSEMDNNIYVFRDENLKMHLVDEYIVNNKIKIKDIMEDEAFEGYLKWKCGVNAKFTYDNLENFSHEFLKKTMLEIEDRKVDKFYPYIQLFLQDKAYDELMDKLNIIYQRFRWEEEVQKLTLEFLKSLSSKEKGGKSFSTNRVVKFICRNENKYKLYKILNSYWLKEGRECDIIEKIYYIIIQKCYNENKPAGYIKLNGRQFE